MRDTIREISGAEMAAVYPPDEEERPASGRSASLRGNATGVGKKRINKKNPSNTVRIYGQDQHREISPIPGSSIDHGKFLLELLRRKGDCINGGAANQGSARPFEDRASAQLTYFIAAPA